MGVMPLVYRAENTLLYSCSGSHMGLITVFADEDAVPCGDLVEGEDGMRWLTTKKQEGRVLSLKPLESVIEVRTAEPLTVVYLRQNPRQ